MTSQTRTWEITEEDGTKRMVTLAQFRAIIDERKAATKPIADAWRNGDLEACTQAQAAFRKRFA
jgi:hypothetical protein